MVVGGFSEGERLINNWREGRGRGGRVTGEFSDTNKIMRKAPSPASSTLNTEHCVLLQNVSLAPSHSAVRQRQSQSQGLSWRVTLVATSGQPRQGQDV